MGWAAEEVKAMAREARRKFWTMGGKLHDILGVTRLWRENEVWTSHKVKNENSASEGDAGAPTKT
jgi:hypothetical protein